MPDVILFSLQLFLVCCYDNEGGSEVNRESVGGQLSYVTLKDTGLCCPTCIIIGVCYILKGYFTQKF